MPVKSPSIFAIAASVLCWASFPAAADEVSCNEIRLTFDSPAAARYCHAGSGRGRSAGSEGGAGWRAKWEFSGADTNGLSIMVTVVRAGLQSYISKRSVREIVDDDSFSITREWGEPYPVEGFEVQDFKAVWPGISAYWNCAAFAQYAVPVAGAPGYRERVSGSYCVPWDLALERDSLARFLASIRY